MSVELTVSGSIATIRFNRPEKLNALTDAMWLQMADHLERCRTDDAVRSIILEGAGKAFCAGADIGGSGRIIERKAGIAGTVQMMAIYDDVVKRLYHMPKPTIAAVHGAVIGIAWTMALCCDWTLAGETTRFRAAFLNLAKVPEGGFQFLAARRAGQLRSRDLVYRSRFVSAEEALDLGLVTRVVAEEALREEARSIAEEAARLAPVTFTLSKQLFNRDAGDFDAFLELELQAIAIAANTQDAAEGTAAFLQRREPRYSGS